MNHYDRFATICTLAAMFVLPACGDGQPGDSDSNTGSGTTTNPVPLTCAYGDNVYEDGEEFDTPDGCVHYRCEDGGLNALTDNRVTIPGDLDLPSQEDVAQQTCLSVVEGGLTISGTAADLTPLGQLTRVGGTLDITASDAVSLTGLESLAEVGAGIIISDNAALTTMAFQPFMSVFGDVTIQNNDALASLAGAEFIGQCGTCSQVPNGDFRGGAADPAEPGIGDGGDQAGGTFFGNILIADNDVLTNVSALGNLWYVWESVRFRNNLALTSLAGIPLIEVQGDFEVTDHPAMPTADVEAFMANISVLGVTTVCGNLDGTVCP